MLPYYRYLVIWSGLYTVHGGFIDWTNDGLGMLSFSNELWNGGQYFNSPALVEQQAQDPEQPDRRPRRRSTYFDDFLEFGDQYVEWKEFDHPQFGKVEMGGWKKTQGRVPPRFMNEELCHRNMAFSLYQADEMPQMKSGETKVEALGGGVLPRARRVHEHEADADDPGQGGGEQRRPSRPDRRLRGVGRHERQRREQWQWQRCARNGGLEILSAGWVASKFRPGATQLIDQKDLTRILVRNGHPGRTTRTIEYIVRGTGEMTVTYDSAKGGRASARVLLK